MVVCRIKKKKKRICLRLHIYFYLSEILIAGLLRPRKSQLEKDTGKSFKMFLNYSDSNNKDGGRVKMC